MGSYSCDCTGTGYEGTDCDTGKYISVLMVYVRIVEYVPTVWDLTPVTVLVPGLREQTVIQVNIWWRLILHVHCESYCVCILLHSRVTICAIYNSIYT